MKTLQTRLFGCAVQCPGKAQFSTYTLFVDGMKTLVGIFRTEGVEEPSMEWYNGGFIWKGKLLLDITVTI